MSFIEVCNYEITLWNLDGRTVTIDMDTDYDGSFSKEIDKESAEKIIKHLKEQFDL